MTRARLVATLAALVWAHSVAAAAGDPAQGGAVYKSNCAACHGPKGEGDGPVAGALTPRPANFKSEESKQKSEAEMLGIINNGVPNTSMPPYESASMS